MMLKWKMVILISLGDLGDREQLQRRKCVIVTVQYLVIFAGLLVVHVQAVNVLYKVVVGGFCYKHVTEHVCLIPQAEDPPAIDIFDNGVLLKKNVILL